MKKVEKTCKSCKETGEEPCDYANATVELEGKTITFCCQPPAEKQAVQTKQLALVVQSGTVDKLYCAFILASTAVAMGWKAHLYFTFWGLQSLVKGAMEKAPLPGDYKHLEEAMQKNLARMKYPTPYEMFKRMKQSGQCKIYACTPTMEMFGIKKEDLIPEIDELAGAATFLTIAADADIQLFI